MTITVKIIRGDDALKYAGDESFLENWKTLADNTAHKTVFQEPEFVSLWFRHYQQSYESILALGYSNSNELIGLMPLAIERNSKVLTQAGAQLAEYSGWLCIAEHGDAFISEAFKTINSNISFSRWHWTYISPGTDTSWLQSSKIRDAGIFIQLESMDSPLLDLHNEEKLKKVLKNKSVKSKINRLKRKGELKIERITDQQRALGLMDQVTNLVNFRHESAHHDAAFEDDKVQRIFYEARTNNLKNNHFSVLWVGEKLLAFHFGYIDEDCIYIGLTAFDPTESKHSPGVIFLIYLANLLIEEGIRFIDLTPGGDEYKERFSNTHNKLYLPTIHISRFEYSKIFLKRKCKSFINNAIKKCNINKEQLTKFLQKDNKQSKHNKGDFYLYSLQSDLKNTKELHPDKHINIQKYSDLLSYKQSDNGISRQHILSDATYRFSREDTLFTLHNNSQLFALAWLSKSGSKYTRLGFEFYNEKNSVVIDCMDLALQLSSIEHMKRLIYVMINHAFSQDVKEAFMFVPKLAHTEDRIEALNKIGFKEVAHSN